MSGDLEQKERQHNLSLFKSGKVKVLVTTDVSARGLHIEGVDAVINYDVPTKDEFYVHRIGRTGRVDKEGYSLTFICEEDIPRFNRIDADYNLKIKEIKHN